MNFIFGLVVGVVVAVGAAYIHDSSLPPGDADGRAIVNWQVFNADARGVRDGVTHGWRRLTGEVRSVGRSARTGVASL